MITKQTPIAPVFDSFHFIKAIPFELYWLGIGAILFVSGNALISHYGETHFIVPQAFFCGAIGAVPILYKVYLEQFRKVTKNLHVLFEMEDDIWEQWLMIEERQAFTMSSKESKLIVGTFIMLVTITLFYLPLPFKSLPLKVFAIGVFYILVAFLSLVVKFSIMLMLFLRKLSDLKTVARFYLFPHPELTKLLRYYSSLSIVSSVGYIALVFSVWFGPYGFNTQMLLWLATLALYPLTLFVWSYFHIHIIQHNIKFSFISLINEQVNESLLKTIEQNDSDNIDKLDKFMGIQTKLHELKEYPFEFGGLITFSLTTVITVIQIVLAFRHQ